MPKSILVLLLLGLSIGGIFFIYSYNTRGGNFYDALLTSEEVEAPQDLLVESSPEPGTGSFGFDVYAAKPGKTVHVDLLNIAIPAFVVVYADDNGNFGEQLGVSSYIEPGFHTNLEFGLNKELVTGQLIHHTLYSDDGNKEYGDRGDIPIREGQHRTVVRDVVVSQ